MGALAPYEQSLSDGTPLQLELEDKRTITFDVPRWLAAADSADLDAVSHAASPVLDVGCGPGRIVEALTRHGHLALGVDIAERAVAMTLARGQNAVRRDVFAPLPGEGRWRTVVLLDGNVGIGGDIDALVARCRTLLAPWGRIIAEIDPDDTKCETGFVRFTIDGRPWGPSFRWSFAGLAAITAAGRRNGFEVEADWGADGRRFALLRRLP